MGGGGGWLARRPGGAAIGARKIVHGPCPAHPRRGGPTRPGGGDDVRLPPLPAASTIALSSIPPSRARGMRLHDFLNPDFVIVDLPGQDVDGVLSALAERARDAGLGDARTIRDRLLERERLHPTAMGSGLAIPHATVPGLAAPAIGVGLAPGEGVPFGPGDAERVRVFFVLLTPAGHEREHVRLLARICRLVRDEGFLDRLATARDPEEALSLISAADGRNP